MEIFFPNRSKGPNPRPLREFLQALANRYITGHFRYGRPTREKKFFTRLLMEARAYKKTRNREHLLNIAVYCLLEIISPELDNTHWNNRAESATRQILGNWSQKG